MEIRARLPHARFRVGRAARSAVVLATSLVLALVGLVVVQPPQARAADPAPITLAKSSGGSVLLGGTADWRLTASNPPDGTEQYNLSFTDTLPQGVAYQPNSTSPAMFGEPQIITIVDDATTTPKKTHQVLIWSNVSDLTPGSSATLSYQTTVSATAFPIGSTVANAAAAYVSTNPRLVPDFNATTGAPVSDPAVTSATAAASTMVTAIKVTKAEPSPEAELLRGLGDHQTVYTLKVTNNSVDQTQSLQVSDYIPAGLEFLGCGGTTIAGGPEYTGANNTVAPVTGGNCHAPLSVDTVSNPAGHPAGVYTKVVWDIGTLAAGGSRTLTYAAAIPQRANTDTWTGTRPSATSGGQAANLHNNNGPSTRETTTEQALTNHVDVTGVFQSQTVLASSSHTVTAEDLSMQKSVSPAVFTQGQQATYTLTVNTGEYADADKLVITDVMPNGLCPLGTSDPDYHAITGCDPTKAAEPSNATITKVARNDDGGYTLTIVPNAAALEHNSTLTIVYKAMMRNWYGAGTDTNPTSADDSFTNTASITGTTTVRSDVDAPEPDGTLTVNDNSSATINAESPTISKLRQANATPMTCSLDASAYKATPGGAAYNLGDRVCFLLSVQFPAGVNTKSAQLTDFLPSNFAYESYHVIEGADLVNSVGTPADAGGVLTWKLGAGDPLIVGKGRLFQVVVSATVATTAPATSTNPTSLARANLAKFRWLNTANQAQSLRDEADVELAPQPTVKLVKGIASITDVITGATTNHNATGNPTNVDGETVRGGDKVVFRVDVRNESQTGAINGRNVSAVDVWDVLPAGITCAAISAISDSGACYDPTTSGRPVLANGDTTSSIVRWQLPSTWTVAPGAYGTVTYAMTVPAVVSVSTVFTNSAAVASYATATNIESPAPVTVTNYPASNIDAAVSADQQLVPAASDTSNVVVYDAVVTKNNVTDITETGNTAAQAVVGETLTYTVGVTIPARTTVHNGKLIDPLPTGVVFVGPASARFSSTGTSPAGDALPSGVSLDTATGTLTFGSTYVNDTDTAQLFEVKIPARIGTDTTNIDATVRTNVATFTSDTAETGGTAITPRTASSSVTVVAPSPMLTKAGTPTTVSGGSVVTYTLTATNPNRSGGSVRPPLHDTWVVDCLPGALTFGTFTQTPSGTSASTTPGTGTNGCQAGRTRIAWNIADLAGNASLALKYTATVTSIPSGGDSYTNTATLSGSTLKDGKTDPTGADNPYERVLTVGASQRLTVSGAMIDKAASPTSLAPGQRGDFTVTVTIPASVAFYNSAVMDALPSQMTFGSTTSTTCVNADSSDCGSGIPWTQLGPNASNVLGWVIGDLAPSTQGRTITIKYTATMNVASNVAGNTRSNTAHYRWNVAGGGSNPTAPSTTWGTNGVSKAASVTVIEPSMSITKTVNGTASAAAAPGDSFTYVVTATNANTTNAAPGYKIAITDAVPAGVIVNPASLAASGGVLAGTAADGSGGTISWTIAGPLAKGATATFTYTGTLAASSKLHNTDPQTNTATVTQYESLPSGGKTYTGPNTSATVTPRFPHVTPTKTVAPGPAYLGQSKAWTITLTNDGGADAQHVSATDTLPPNWTYDTGSANVAVAGAAGTPVEPAATTDASGNQVLTWTDLGTAPATGTKTIVITFTATPKNPEAAVAPGVGSGVPHTNTVSTTAKDATGATGNLTGAYNAGPATANTRIDSADLKIVKASDHKAVAGGTLTYTLTVSNTTENGVGGDTAVGPFTVTDTLPSGLGTVAAAGTGWTCQVTTTAVTCSRTNASETLASGASFPAITVTAAIPSDTAGSTSLKNTATVSGVTHDPKLDNNSSEVTDTVSRQVDLQIVKAVSSSPVVAGENVTYTLNVRNNGLSDSASGEFVVTDDLQPGLSYVSAVGTDWSCGEVSAGTGKIRCTTTKAPKVNGTLPTITVTAKVATGATGEIPNTAVVAGPEPLLDPHPENNSHTAKINPSTSADLALSKVHSTGSDDWIAGGTGTYTFTVLNYGPSDAAAPEVVDTLPSSLTFVAGSTSGTHWSCSASGQKVTCTRDAALAGGTGSAPTSEQFSFKVTVAASLPAGTNIANEAEISSTTNDPNPGNNKGTDNTNTTQRADLGITKSGPGTAVAGDGVIAFTLGVHNYGESDTPAPVAGSISPITVVDTLPAGMSYDSFSGTNWSCSAAGQTVTCTLAAGLVAGGDAPALTIRAAVASNVAAGTLRNYASVSGPLRDVQPANNTASKDVAITVSPALTITKAAAPSTVWAGNEVTYTIVVGSTGPSDATNVVVSDPLATGLTFVSIDGPSGWTCSDTAAQCSRPRLAAGATATFTVTARVGSGVADGASIPNRATVTGDGGLSKTADATVGVVARADLTLAKSHPNDDRPVLAGESVTFTLKVRNAGPSDAQPDVKVVDTLPAGMTFAGSSGVWDCTAAGQVVTCVLPGDAVLPAKQDAPSLTITATVAADLDPAVTKLTNSAKVSSGTTDPVPDNNRDTDDVLIGYQADLSITKSHPADTVRVGDPLTFTLQVANAGPSVARNAVVTDTLPSSLAYVSSDGGTDWTCTFTAPTLECAANADVAVGTPGAITVTTTVTAAAYPGVENIAKISSDTADPDDTNNSSTDRVTVPPKVDLSITKSHTPEPLQVGQQGTYVLTVANSGATDDPGTLKVTDSLPAGLTFVSASGDGWTCSASGQDVGCERPAGLATGKDSVITLLVTVGPQAYPAVTNVATVSSPAEDTDLSNNSASDPATVLPLYDLSLAKTVKGVTRSTVSWTLAVTNAGPNEAPAGASFVDTLPTALTYSGSIGDGWTCSAAGQVVTCSHSGPIAPGATVSVILVTTVPSGFSGTVVNRAVLGGDGASAEASATVKKSDGSLAYTGMDLGLGLVGLVLILGGALVVFVRRQEG